MALACTKQSFLLSQFLLTIVCLGCYFPLWTMRTERNRVPTSREEKVRWCVPCADPETSDFYLTSKCILTRLFPPHHYSLSPNIISLDKLSMIPAAKFTNLLSFYFSIRALFYFLCSILFFILWNCLTYLLLSMFIFSFLTLESKLVEQELGLSFLSQDPGS